MFPFSVAEVSSLLDQNHSIANSEPKMCSFMSLGFTNLLILDFIRHKFPASILRKIKSLKNKMKSFFSLCKSNIKVPPPSIPSLHLLLPRDSLIQMMLDFFSCNFELERSSKTRLFGPKDFLISLKTQKRNGFCRKKNVKFGKVKEGEGEGTPICFYVIHLLNDAHYKRSQKSF